VKLRGLLINVPQKLKKKKWLYTLNIFWVLRPLPNVKLTIKKITWNGLRKSAMLNVKSF
jgi:hypothetical protein